MLQGWNERRARHQRGPEKERGEEGKGEIRRRKCRTGKRTKPGPCTETGGDLYFSIV